jgi:hypothetical protein
MAVPEGVTPVYNNIIVSVYQLGSGFGIKGNSPTARVGSVYKIGENCYRIAVNDKIGFLTTQAQFATDLDETFAVILEEDVLITYVAPTPP